jgi:hypothetical protein
VRIVRSSISRGIAENMPPAAVNGGPKPLRGKPRERGYGVHASQEESTLSHATSRFGYAKAKVKRSSHAKSNDSPDFGQVVSTASLETMNCRFSGSNSNALTRKTSLSFFKNDSYASTESG